MFLPFFPRRDGSEMHFIGFLGSSHELEAYLVTLSCISSPFWLCCPEILLSGKTLPSKLSHVKNGGN